MPTLALLLLGALLVAQPNRAQEYSCDAGRKPCVLHDVNLDSQDDLYYATLPEREHSLIIASGRIPFFTRQLAQKLVNTVDLTMNGLETLEMYVAPEMTHLEAANNQIATLTLDDAVMYDLISLNLTKNKLREVMVLSRCTKLRMLTLDDNELHSLSMDTFAGMLELRTLSLARNQITTIETSASLNLVKLHTLSLAGNQLYEIDIQQWELDSLNKLDLSNNDLYLLSGDIAKFRLLKHANIAGNHWKCDYLLEMLRSTQFTFQPDDDSLCSEKRMRTVRQICCNPDATSFLGETRDDGELDSLFKDKWDELRALGEAVQTLNHSALTTLEQANEEAVSREATLKEQLEQLEGRYEDLERKLEERDSTVALDETNQLKEIAADHKDRIYELTEKQSEVENRMQGVEQKFENILIKIESFDREMQKCTLLEKRVRELEEQQLRYKILGVELKTRTNELGLKVEKSSELKDRILDIERDISFIRKILHEITESKEY